MSELPFVIQEYVMNLQILLPCAFLCFFTVREKLRIGPIKITVITFIAVTVFSLAFSTLFELTRIPWNAAVIPFLVIAFFFYRRITDTEPYKLIFIMLLVATFFFFMNTFTLVIRVSNFVPDQRRWSAEYSLLLLGATIVMLPLFTWFMRKKLWPYLMHLQSATTRFLWILPTIFLIISGFIVQFYAKLGLINSLHWSFITVMILLLLASFMTYWLLLYSIHRSSENTRYRERVKAADEQSSLMADRIADMAAHSEEIKLLRHDMRHHLTVLGHLIHEHRYSEAEEFLKQYTGEAEDLTQPPLCRNPVVDILLRRYFTQAHEQGVRVDHRLVAENNTGFANTDLCIILGNLLENALRACSSCPQDRRFLSVMIRIKNEEALISVENSTVGDSVESRGNEKGEGLGIPSINAIAERYGGIAKFEERAGVFYASALLYSR